MIYERLQVILLSTIASEKEGSTNEIIASYILNHQKETAEMGIQELSEAIHAGTGTISRFCREIGLQDFAELRNLLRNSITDYQIVQSSQESMAEQIGDSILQASKSLDREKIIHLAKDIRTYQNVSAFGLLKAVSAAICLQTDMRMLGKEVYTSISYKEQMEHILRAGKDELIVLFSYTGSYFEGNAFRQKEKHLFLPKIVMFCGGNQAVPWYVDETIRFTSKLEQITHPYQLLICESELAQTYARLINEKY